MWTNGEKMSFSRFSGGVAENYADAWSNREAVAILEATVELMNTESLVIF